MDRFVVLVVVVDDDDDGRGAGDESFVKSSMHRCSMVQGTLVGENRGISAKV